MKALTVRRRTSSWDEVVAFYAGLAADDVRFGPVLRLVEYLATSRYARSLFPHIAHDGVLLGRSPTFAPGGGELHVRFDAAAPGFVFTHVQRADEARPWQRTCAVEDWQAALERVFHKRLHWFHEG